MTDLWKPRQGRVTEKCDSAYLATCEDTPSGGNL